MTSWPRSWRLAPFPQNVSHSHCGSVGDALKRSIPEGTRNAELKNEALRLGRELLRGTKYEDEG